jgi:hypothetical protein
MLFGLIAKGENKMDELIEKLVYAKKAVTWLLIHSDGSVDFHGIAYWAGEVERLRIEIKELL